MSMLLAVTHMCGCMRIDGIKKNDYLCTLKCGAKVIIFILK